MIYDCTAPNAAHLTPPLKEIHMKKLFIALLFALPFMATPAFAAKSSVAATCKAEAAGLKGAERKASIAECKKRAAPEKKAKRAGNPKMAACSADFKATGKPGRERKAFMSDCLKK
jgi:psiF repeat